jgi:dTDP-4-amino-4,6-dideoxygalactose transaminase
MRVSRSVPFFNYPALFAAKETEYMAVIRDVLARGAYIMQSDLHTFEERLAGYVGARHALGVADGTMAITFGLLAAGAGPGDEVLVPSHTFVATAAAVHHTGATPVLVDCATDHLIDPESVRLAITSRTKIILPVQLNGRTANMDMLCRIGREHDLKIVEDSCQALGSKFAGRCAGTFGVAGSFSFYPSKTLGCFGDGGAIVTDDDAVADMAKALRDHGRGKDGRVTRWGYNARLDNLQAAILNHKLDTYDQAIARRRRLASLYDERLSGLNQLMLPPPPDSDPLHYDIFQNYEIEADRRDELVKFLSGHGIGTLLQWGGKTIHQFAELGVRGDVPYTEKMTARYMMLPMNTSLTDDDVHYVCDRIVEFYRA